MTGVVSVLAVVSRSAPLPGSAPGTAVRIG